MSFDLKITGGTLYDGTGGAGVKGDIAVKDGKIITMGGTIEGDAAKTIDATGHAVSPGFVDVHTHYDAQIFWDKKLSVSPWHGVTTAVLGNCGFGVAPTRPHHRERLMRTLEKVEGMSYEALEAGLGLEWPFESFGEYLDVLESSGSAINVAVLFGHTPVRTYVMGDDAVKREANAEEVKEMAALVEQGMADGAIGFSTSHAATHHGYGGTPIPSRLAAVSEIDALVGAAARGGRAIMQATVGRTLFYDEFAEIASNHNVPVTWTALLSGLSGPGSHRGHQKKTQALVDRGLEVVPQVACRPINFDFHFDQPFPFEMRPLFKPTMVTDRAGRREIYSSKDFRQGFKDDTDSSAKHPLSLWYDRAVVSNNPMDPSSHEKPLNEVADAAGKHPIDYVLDLSLETDFTARFRFPILNHNEEEVAELLQDENMVVALSDAGAHASQLCDACYSSHLLGYWVRERGTLELPRAIHMLTQRPAELFGITDRGLLAKGRPADIVVFDPKTIGAGKLERVYDLPAGADRMIVEAYGIKAVVVNGTMVRENNVDALNGSLPGRVLRSGHA